ncbi:MAG: toxin-antitoxin system HicB family antitoxin [Desulfovibrionales bacterium]|nr:MAG: toxin-antitoxin system HicB family antitoxin [Desulfovibrionales bacterium]
MRAPALLSKWSSQVGAGAATQQLGVFQWTAKAAMLAEAQGKSLNTWAQEALQQDIAAH